MHFLSLSLSLGLRFEEDLATAQLRWSFCTRLLLITRSAMFWVVVLRSDILNIWVTLRWTLHNMFVVTSRNCSLRTQTVVKKKNTSSTLPDSLWLQTVPRRIWVLACVMYGVVNKCVHARPRRHASVCAIYQAHSSGGEPCSHLLTHCLFNMTAYSVNAQLAIRHVAARVSLFFIL